MQWMLLGFAILFEVSGTVCLKLSEGFSRLTPTLLIFPAYAVSFVLLGLAVKAIPISVAYAIWAGVGTALIAVIGMIWLREPVGVGKLVFITVIVVGVVGLHLSERAEG